MNLSKDLLVYKEIFSDTLVKENTMNLSKDLSVDKELFSRERSSKENTMNLSKDLSVDKELFSRERSSKENTDKPTYEELLQKIKKLESNITYLQDFLALEIIEYYNDCKSLSNTASYYKFESVRECFNALAYYNGNKDSLYNASDFDIYKNHIFNNNSEYDDILDYNDCENDEESESECESNQESECESNQESECESDEESDEENNQESYEESDEENNQESDEESECEK